jgi:hypothetical protein
MHTSLLFAVLYVAAIGCVCVLGAVVVVKDSNRFIPLYAVAALLLVSGAFATASAVALVRRARASIVYSCLCISWTVTVFVIQSVYVCLSCTASQTIAGSGAIIIFPLAVGLVLIEKAEAVEPMPKRGTASE